MGVCLLVRVVAVVWWLVFRVFLWVCCGWLCCGLLIALYCFSFYLFYVLRTGWLFWLVPVLSDFVAFGWFVVLVYCCLLLL